LQTVREISPSRTRPFLFLIAGLFAASSLAAEEETVRAPAALWSQIMPNSYHFEQAFSADFGKSWEPNFIAGLTRERD
jgi:hypothetical protein